MDKDYLSSFESEDINEEDFKNINEDLSELDKKRIKKALRKKVKNNNSYKKLKVIIASGLTACILIGLSFDSAKAGKLPYLEKVYESMGFYSEYKEYTQYIGKVIEENGLKITIENLAITKDKGKVALKIEADENIEIDKLVQTNVSIGMKDSVVNDGSSQGYVSENTNEKRNVYYGVFEQSSKEGFDKRGDLYITIKNNYFNINKQIKLRVDFSESFNKILEKKINTTVEGIKFNEIKTDVLGSKVYYTRDRNKEDSSNMLNNKLLKVDNKIYLPSSGGEGTGGLFTKKTKGYIGFDLATYDNVKDAKKISLITLNESYSKELMEEKFKEMEEYYNSKDMLNVNNISYIKQYDYIQGTKGEVYKIEREGESVKVYCRSIDENKSLLMAYTTNLSKSKNEYNIYQNYSKILYKDEEDKLGYIVEFNGVDPELELEVRTLEDLRVFDSDFGIKSEVILK